MKAWKIDLRPYPMPEGGGEYDVRRVLSDMLISPLLGLSGMGLLLNFEVRTALKDCKDDFFLATPEQYEKLRIAVDGQKWQGMGYGLNDVEMVRRVLKAEEVEAEVKAAGPPKA